MKRLTIKEKKLVHYKAKGDTHKKAYRKAGYSMNSNEASIVSNTDKILKKPHVKEALEKALIKHDITLDNALSPISKGLKAKKLVQDRSGRIIDEVEDLDLQIKASDRALKLLGVNKENAPNLHLHQHLHNQSNTYDL